MSRLGRQQSPSLVVVLRMEPHGDLPDQHGLAVAEKNKGKFPRQEFALRSHILTI
jgi:hypothetical protein